MGPGCSGGAGIPAAAGAGKISADIAADDNYSGSQFPVQSGDDGISSPVGSRRTVDNYIVRGIAGGIRLLSVLSLIIRFGVEKGRMVMILSCLLVAGILVLGFGGLSAANGGLSNIPDSTFLYWLFAVGLPLLALLAAISYFLSLRFYEAREVC